MLHKLVIATVLLQQSMAEEGNNGTEEKKNPNKVERISRSLRESDRGGEMLELESLEEEFERRFPSRLDDASAAGRGLPVYVRNRDDTIQVVELPADATVGDLQECVQQQVGEATVGTLHYQGDELMDAACILADLGIGAESVVDIHLPVRKVRVNVGFFFNYSKDCIEIPETIVVRAVDYDAFIAALRAKILEKIQSETPGWPNDNIQARVKAKNLQLHPLGRYNDFFRNSDRLNGIEHLATYWKLPIPQDWERKLDGEAIDGRTFDVGIRIWASEEEM